MNRELILNVIHKFDEFKENPKCTYYKSETETETIEKFTFHITKPYDGEITVVKEVFPDGGVNLSSEQISEDGVPMWSSFIGNDEILNQVLLAIESEKSDIKDIEK